MSVAEDNDITAIQRHLNAVRDPVATLPFELASKIFVHSLPFNPLLGSNHIPMLLMNVCSAWFAIAQSTPALWATIQVHFPRSGNFSKLLEMWFRRAGNHLLSVYIHRFFDTGVAAILERHAGQFRSLEIHHGGYHPRLWIPFVVVSFLFLERLKLRSRPSDFLMEFSVYRIFEMLRRAPNLVECTLEDILLLDTSKIHTSAEKITLLSLQHLIIGETGTRNEEGVVTEDARLLTYLTLPALETLELPTLHSYHHSFLVRSSPPLRKLVLADNDEDFAQIDECLRLVPLLIHLEFKCTTNGFLDGLLTALEESPSTLLPNLGILKVYDPWLDIANFTKPSYETLLRVLSARRNQVISFQLVFYPVTVTSDVGGPDAEMCAAF
ncbi:hypothetical protein B0H19DRAFT_1367706 [Mycena capillaripes]|nr:hypothetical protein B0H19DRAFT_1367706 [Mycena capillaripes]